MRPSCVNSVRAKRKFSGVVALVVRCTSSSKFSTPFQLMKTHTLQLFCTWAAVVSGTALAAAPATGPLRVSTVNPRYFTDGSGKAIFLTGSHTWGNLQDYTYAKLTSPPAMDF